MRLQQANLGFTSRPAASKPAARPDRRVAAASPASGLRLLTSLVPLAALLAGAAPRLAAAAPDVRTVLSRDGLALLVEQLVLELASDQLLPDFDTDLYSCPVVGGSARIAASDVRIDSSADAVSAHTSAGRLTLTAYLDLTGAARLLASNLLCLDNALGDTAGGDIGCATGFTLRDVPVRIDVVPRVEDNRIRLADAEVRIDLGAHHLDLDLSACGLAGDLAQIAYGLVGQNLVALLRPQLERLAREQLVTQVERLLSDFGQLGSRAGQLELAARVTGIPVDREGLGADAEVEVSPAGQPSCTVGAPTPRPASSTVEPRLAFEGEQVGLAISRAFLQNAVVAAWQGGLFCLGEAGSPLGGSGLAGVWLEVPNAPELTLLRGDDARLRIVVRDLVLGLGNDKAFSAQLDLAVELSLRVDTSSAVLISEPTVALRNLRVSAESTSLIDFEKLIRELLPALVTELLRDQVLLPRVFQAGDGLFQDLYFYVARAETTAEHVLLYAKVGQQPEKDDEAPETELVEAPNGWAAAKVRAVASGADDLTPAPLLRYSWRADQGAWTEPELAASREFQLPSGAHTIEVVAVDLNGNRDPTPAMVLFQVDAVAPEIAITRAPPDKLDEPAFAVDFRLSDDRTPVGELIVHVRIERQLEPGAPEDLNVIEDELVGRTRLDLFPLGPGVHTLSLVAEDAVGNRSPPAEATFEALAKAAEEPTKEGQGGCCAVRARADNRADDHQALSFLLALLLLGMRARRRPNRLEAESKLRPKR